MQPQSCSRVKTCVVSFILGYMILPGLAVAQSMSPESTTPLTPGTFRLTVTTREIALDAYEASLAAILAEIGQRTGIPIVIYPGMNEQITIHLSQMPLEKALKQLTPNVAIATAQGPHATPHRIAKVYVLPKGQTGPSRLDSGPTPGRFQFTFDPSQHMNPSR